MAEVTASSAKSEVIIAPSTILAEVTASSAKSEVTIAPSTIFAEVTTLSANLEVVIAPAATVGDAAVPVKSPASWIFPFDEAVASGIEPATIELST